MKNIFWILLTWMTVANSYSQAQNQIDSLENKLKGDLPDSVRLDVLIALSHQNQYTDFERSRQYADDAVKLAETVDNRALKVKAYRNKGANTTSTGDYTTSLKYDNLSLENSIAIKDSLNMSRDYSAIGNDYYDLGEYDDAFFYFTQSHRVAAMIGDSLRILIATHNVGRVFKEMGQYDEAMRYLNKSMEMSRRQDDKEGIAYTLDEIGDIQLRKRQFDSSEASLFAALQSARDQKVNLLQPKIFAKLANVSFRKEKFANALIYYDSAYALHELTKDRYGMAEVELGRGIVFTKEGRYDEALKKIETGLALAKQLHARVLEIKCYNQLSLLWEMKADFRKSLLYYKQYKLMEDSLFSQEIQSRLLRDQLHFETESRDSRIAFLSEQQKMQRSELKKQEFVRNILAVVMALSVILLLSVYRSGRRRRQINTLLLQHQEEMEKRSEELERLNQVKDKFFSIISHDLRSPINALSGLLDLLDKGAISATELPKHIKELKIRFNHTRTLLNNLLDWTLLQMDKLSLQAAKIDVYSIVEENIQLLSSVKNKDITLVNEVPKNAIGFADSNTINLVIRNLMTNSIKFTNGGGVVRVAAIEKGSEWLVSVNDNGVGMPDEVLKMLFDKTAPYTTRGTANEKGTGLGLILCKEFVEKNGGKIWVESEEGKGSTFYFTLPKA
ncbi:MAG: tetratricopeptide repeat-containing sensor histidine kinase [Chryseolinea sp.]